jgi:hypothetical protein
MLEKTRTNILAVGLLLAACGCAELSFMLETQFALNRGLYRERDTMAAACYGEGLATGSLRADVIAAKASGVIVPNDMVRAAFQPPTDGCKTPADAAKAAP